MQILNTEDSYGIVTKLFHWIMAILIITMLTIGLYMINLPRGVEKLRWFGLHKELGILVLMLIVPRIIWRLATITPNLADLPRWEFLAARFVHWALFILMFLLPLSGWMMTSSAGLSVSFFGWFVLPDIVPADKNLRDFFVEAHEFLAYTLLALVIIHVLAALKHQFIDRDNILRRMI